MVTLLYNIQWFMLLTIQGIGQFDNEPCLQCETNGITHLKTY